MSREGDIRVYIALAGLFDVNYTFWGHCVHKIYRLGGACVRGRTDKVHLYDAERGGGVLYGCHSGDQDEYCTSVLLI